MAISTAAGIDTMPSTRLAVARPDAGDVVVVAGAESRPKRLPSARRVAV